MKRKLTERQAFEAWAWTKVDQIPSLRLDECAKRKYYVDHSARVAFAAWQASARRRRK